MDATLTVKSFHFRLYFWEDPILCKDLRGVGGVFDFVLAIFPEPTSPMKNPSCSSGGEQEQRRDGFNFTCKEESKLNDEDDGRNAIIIGNRPRQKKSDSDSYGCHLGRKTSSRLTREQLSTSSDEAIFRLGQERNF